uniref:interleukin-8-like n=1 Tax=Pristiophorus japonicus TaxID=55135 RepID=UPI00398E50F4
MNRTANVTILILLLCAITAQGIPIPGTQGRCQCIQTSSDFIHPSLVQSLKYIPKGSHCKTQEIIVTKRNGKKSCVNPEAKWVQIIIKPKIALPPSLGLTPASLALGRQAHLPPSLRASSCCCSD